MQTAVSIVIINYNTFQLTCNCIESVMAHTSGVSYEIILVDNASSECDADLFKQKFPSINLITSQTNLGFAGGNNLGLQQTHGEYILLLNSDTVLTEDVISYVHRKAAGISNLGAATAKLIYPDGTVQPAAGTFLSVKKHFLEVTRLFKIFRRTYAGLVKQYDFETDFSCDWIWGTFFFFPKKNLDAAGGQLSANYFMYFEDVEWCYHFRKAGLVNRYFAGSKLVHLIGKSSSGTFKEKLMRKSHLRFVRINYGFFAYLLEALLLRADDLELSIRKPKPKS